MNKQLVLSTLILLSSCITNAMHPELEQAYREVRFAARSFTVESSNGLTLDIGCQDHYQSKLPLVRPEYLIRICANPGSLWNDKEFLAEMHNARNSEYDQYEAELAIDRYFKQHIENTDKGRELKEVAHKFFYVQLAIRTRPFDVAKQMYEQRSQYGLPHTLANQVSEFLDIPYRS